MVHRGMGREPGLWWKLGRDLLLCTIAGLVGTGVFILGDIILYGHVNW